MSRLIPDLENIVSEYCDVDDYAKLIKLSKRYSWQKYFPILPNIYQAIEEYDNLDLVEYIDSSRNTTIQYLDVEFHSIQVVKYIIDKYSPKQYHYVYILRSSVYKGKMKLFKYLMDLKLYPMTGIDYRGILQSACAPDNLGFLIEVNNEILKMIGSKFHYEFVLTRGFFQAIHLNYSNKEIGDYFRDLKLKKVIYKKFRF